MADCDLRGVCVLIRVPIYLLSLLGSSVDRRGRLLIAWFGPSGLSSLLLILLAVFCRDAGQRQALRNLFADRSDIGRDPRRFSNVTGALQ